MRALILTITTGQGHNQVAANLCSCLKERGIEALSMDVLEYINTGLKEVVSQGYLMSTKRLPKVYGKVYRMAEKRDSEGRVLKITSSIMARKLVKFLDEFMPDVIVCTHVFAAMLITSIKKKIGDNVKSVGIVTDFTIHPYWEETQLDYYITATELLTNQAIKKGIGKEQVLPFGIPIDGKFSKRVEKSVARKELGFEDKYTVLVMSGSMGYGKIAKMIKAIDESDNDFQIITVCGHNTKLKKEIGKTDFKHRVYNFGFSDRVDLFMDASDCIVTKPGGLTTSEALAKGLPIIMANPIPGHEDRNVEFLLNNGAALKVGSTFPIDEAIYQIFTNTTRLENLKEMAEKLGRGDATEKFVEFVLTLDEGGNSHSEA